MPASTMRNESEYLIPEDTPLPSVLENVEVVEFPGKDRETGQPDGSTYARWRWTFRIKEGEYAGLKVEGLTTPFISTHPENKVRLWSESLRNKVWGESEGIDTDDLIGLPCIVTAKHQPPRERRDGKGKWYGVEIQDVYPAEALDEPPF